MNNLFKFEYTVIDWIFNNGFDSILVTEDNIENYICKKNNIKSIENY